MLDQWLRAALKAARMKQAELSRRLTAALGRSVDAAAIGKLLRGERRMYADELIEIARVCGYPTPTTIDGTVDETQRILRELQREDLQMKDAAFEFVTRIQFREDGSNIFIRRDSLKQIVSYSLLQSELNIRSEEIRALTDDIVTAVAAVSAPRSLAVTSLSSPELEKNAATSSEGLEKRLTPVDEGKVDELRRQWTAGLASKEVGASPVDEKKREQPAMRRKGR